MQRRLNAWEVRWPYCTIVYLTLIGNTGNPCKSCEPRGHPCTYPHRDVQVTVSERYIRELQHAAFSRTNLTPGVLEAQPAERRQKTVQTAANALRPLFGNTTAEAFVSGLRQSGWGSDSPVCRNYTEHGCEALSTFSAGKSRKHDYVVLNAEKNSKLQEACDSPTQTDGE